VVGSMQESPTLLILRCRARHHAGKRHSHTHSTPGSGRAFPPMQLMGGASAVTRKLPCGEDFFCVFAFLPAFPCDSRLLFEYGESK
jgi:hypothetical protein